ncbi:hypothetical protein KII95_08675 [Leuconostoc gelidum subsp. aenigmaticum]|uniref:hypothetical protein n=1 Tax=Leuconostoc gelidum TaxID=1244 RepID=UPI001CC62839|nr:hypothetical protein [Leuconostoc gelidum]MBZ6004081.1 hypothetical protein [Leuconostoc gelidum subsp. aenigmaticum]
MQNMQRFFVQSTEQMPIEIVTRSIGYYITDTQNRSIISRQDVTGQFGISDEKLLNLFGDDGVVFEKQDDARKVALSLKNSI